MKIISLDEVEKIVPQMQGASRVFKQVPISKDDGAPTFSFRVFTLEPGGHTPFHRHSYEHVNYVIEGEGVILGADGQETPIKRGDFSLVLPDEKHQYRNSSASNTLIVICAVPSAYE